MKLYGIWLGLFVGILGTVACGGDDSDDDDDGSGGTAASSSGGKGGTSSSGGKGGTSSSGGEGGTSTGGTSSNGGEGGTSTGGTSSNGGFGGTDVCDPTGMGPDTTCEPHVECIQAECGSQAAECLGASWSEGDFTGGVCSDVFTCMSACGCDDVDCAFGCLGDIDAECLTCFETLETCSAACEEEAASCE